MRSRTLLLALVALVFGGCASSDSQRELYASLPLAFDPTEQHTLGAWWTNGTHLLHLAPDQSYRRFASNNRYHDPVERGRWSQHSYAALWLEPYETYQHDRHRVSIIKRQGDLRLQLGDGPAWWSLPAAPRVLEDQLIGLWEGSSGRLWLRDDLEYELWLPDAGDAAARVVGHQGRWSVADNVLVLDPDSPRVENARVLILDETGSLVLQTRDGPLRRLTDEG